MYIRSIFLGLFFLGSVYVIYTMQKKETKKEVAVSQELYSCGTGVLLWQCPICNTYLARKTPCTNPDCPAHMKKKM